MSIIDMITRNLGLQDTGHLQGRGPRGTGHLQGRGPRGTDLLQGRGPRGWGVLQVAGLQAVGPQVRVDHHDPPRGRQVEPGREVFLNIRFCTKRRSKNRDLSFFEIKPEVGNMSLMAIGGPSFTICHDF
jgi:hypothetical protein